MLKRSTLQHLRFPFSFFLLPVFAFAATQELVTDWWQFLAVFFILHFLLYPASNGFNSYYDKDEGSIGGVKKPLPVSRELLWISLSMDVLALALGLFISRQFTFMLLIYGLVSKAYSHPLIRIKKYPVLSLIILVVFQGIFTFFMILVGIHDLSLIKLISAKSVFGAFLTGFLLMGFYPLTQVYQHDEDAKRGDKTISLLLGIKGTFHFSLVIFLTSILGFYIYFKAFYNINDFLGFLVALTPAFLFFLFWYFKVLKNTKFADFYGCMMFVLLASGGFTFFFFGFYVLGLIT